jgi:hypothetical protein
MSGTAASSAGVAGYGYATSLQHVVAQLERLDLLIRAQVWRARQRSDGDEDGLAAFYIAEGEVDALLERPLGVPSWAALPLPAGVREAVQARLDQMLAEIAGRAAASTREGVVLRLDLLAERFGLTDFDADVVVACLAPELDRRYERLYAYLQDDVTRAEPTVDLLLNLYCPDLATKVAARGRFGPAAPLLGHHLLHLADAPDPRSATLLGRSVRLDPRVAGFLLDDDEIDNRLRPYLRLVAPTRGLDAMVLPADFRQRLSRLIRHTQVERSRCGAADLVVYCQGSYGTGRRTAAAAWCRALGVPLLTVAGRWLAALEAPECAALARLIDREARLQGALLYWQDFDAVLAADRAAHLAALQPLLDTLPGPVFLAGNTPWEPSDARRDVAFVRLAFPQPSTGERARLWRAALAQEASSVQPGLDLATVAGAFRLSGGQIRDAAATAGHLAAARDPAAPRIVEADLHAACRLQSNRGLAALATRIDPRYGWDDIVLPARQLAQLHDVHDQVRYRALVYETWGFDRRLALGKGLVVLFAGPPGTGKTMAADVLANVLGLDLYRIDLSTVVSKYIGETEKNLASIFAEARTSNAILFFDEADALFGKRTQVRDAHDRYANVEISYLLQQVEEHDGVVILATNLRKNLDEAFVRRLHATVDFPVPGEAERRRIWTQIWPAETPRDRDLDLGLLARQVEVTGGNIRNIAVAAAFLAAADGGVVTMPHLLQATRREYQKMGKVLTAAEFGPDPTADPAGAPS